MTECDNGTFDDDDGYIIVEHNDVDLSEIPVQNGEVIQRLDEHQKNVDLARVVGNAECALGSFLGLVGAGLLFSPLAATGVAVGLVGVGFGLKGVALEGGASIANYVAGQNAIKEFDDDMKSASIDREATSSIWRKICYCSRDGTETSDDDKSELAIEFIQEVGKWNIPEYHRRKQKYTRKNNNSNDVALSDKYKNENDNAEESPGSSEIPWYQFWRSKEKEEESKKKLILLLDFIANFWLTKIIECAKELKRNEFNEIPDGAMREELYVMKSVITSAGSIANGTRTIVNTSLRIASGGLNALDEIAHETLQLASVTLNSLDDVGTATGHVMKTAKSVINSPMFGIVTGSVGFIMASVFLGMNIDSINNGSKSEKEQALLVFMQQIDLSCEMMQNIADALVAS